VTIFADGELRRFLESYAKDLATIFIVSEVSLKPLSDAFPDAVELIVPKTGLKVQAQGDVIISDEPLTDKIRVKVEKAPGKKCERCWAYRDTVGRSKKHPAVCHRCVEAMEA